MIVLAGVAGSWSDEYGNRAVTGLGAIISLAGFILASYSTELWHLYLTQGLIVGIGFWYVTYLN